MNYDKLTVGQLAKKVNVTVRTLQYYDKINLLKPSSFTEGGRRLYSANDITILHQIITLKSLGLSLEAIKEKLVPINSNDDVKRMLTKQTELINEQISIANNVLVSIDMIMKEIEASDTVDWSKYANMVKLINENNEHFWIMNFLDDDMLSNISKVHNQFSEKEIPSDWLIKYMKTIIELIDKDHTPSSPEAQLLAKEMWGILEKYSGEQPDMIKKLYDFYSQGNKWPSKYAVMQEKSFKFIEEAIEFYLGDQPIEPPKEQGE